MSLKGVRVIIIKVGLCIKMARLDKFSNGSRARGGLHATISECAYLNFVRAFAPTDTRRLEIRIVVRLRLTGNTTGGGGKIDVQMY